MKKTLIAPSILSADFADLKNEIKKVEDAGADWLHIDVMDGRFVPNISIGVPVVQSVRKVTDLPLDVHLMIVEPIKYVKPFAEAGADYITFHIEACENNAEVTNRHSEPPAQSWRAEESHDLRQSHEIFQHDSKLSAQDDDSMQTALLNAEATINEIKKYGVKAGISIKPNTPVSVIEPLLEKLDLVLVMTVEPGFGGQAFMPECLEKIRELRELADKKGLDYHIEVDGGINTETAKLAAEAGADVLVAGSFVYKASNIKEAIDSLKP